MTNIKPTNIRLPAFFSNLLPEGQMREYLAANIGVNERQEYFLIRALGRDLPGAVTIEGAKEDSAISKLKNKIQEHENTYRFSLAGVQLKFSAVKAATGGLTIPASGVGGDWIIKLPSMNFPKVPANEYSMMKLASKMGMQIPEVKLIKLQEITGIPQDLNINEEYAFAIKRFDRENGKKIHIEDFAQIFNVYSEKKYEKGNYKNIANVIKIESGLDDVVEFVKRLVFNTLIGNADMHLKNWSLIYPDGKNAKLAPGYDFVSTIAYIPDERMALKFAKTKLMAKLSLELLEHFAMKISAPKQLIMSTAKETVSQFNRIWATQKNHLPLEPSVITAIEKNISAIELVKEV